MKIDFLDELNESNSIKNEETGEIILTVPVFNASCDYIIERPCKISSNCNTLIKSEHFEITSHSVYLDGLTFETAINLVSSDNFQITNSTIRQTTAADGSICISNSKSVHISDVTISDCQAIPGIYITRFSTVTCQNVHISNSSETLLVCNSNSSVYIEDSILDHSKANGIYASDDAYVEIRRSKIEWTEYPAILLTKSKCIIEDNSISNVSQNGISLNSVKSFIVRKNRITAVNGSAISVMDGSSGFVHRNEISEIGGNGIYVSSSSRVVACKNRIANNDYPGIAILMKSRASLLMNEVTNIKFNGICIRGATRATLVRNTIKNVNQCGVSISDTKLCTIENSLFENCKIAAVEAYNKSNVVVIGNTMVNLGEFAFFVYVLGKMEAKNNIVKNVGKAFVKLLYKGGGSFENNQIENCPEQKDSQTSSDYVFRNNGGFKSVTNIKNFQDESIELEDGFVDKNNLCIRCNKNPRNCFLLTCGHKVFCKECADAAFINKEQCPICRIPISKVTVGFTSSSDEICVICLEKKADCIVVPCGHMGFCHHCLGHWFIHNKSCPICRTEPATFQVIINCF